MHVLKRRAVAPRAAIIAATLALARRRRHSVFAEDPAPVDSPKAPVITPAEPTPPASPAAGSAAEHRGEPCFTGKGSIKEVLDSCAAFCLGLETIRRSSPPPMAIARSASRRPAIMMRRHRDEQGDRAQTEDPNRYLSGAPPTRQEGFRQGHRRLDKAISLDANRGDFYTMRGIDLRRKAISTKPSRNSTGRSSSIQNRRIGYAKRAEIYRRRRTMTAPSPTIAKPSRAIPIQPRVMSIAAGSTYSRTISTRRARISTPRLSSTRTTPRRWSDVG